MEETQVVVRLISLKALLTAALIGLYCAGGGEKIQFMSLMVCELKPGLLSKGWAGSHFIEAVCICKR